MELPEEIQLVNPDIAWGRVYHKGRFYEVISRDGDTVTCRLLTQEEYQQLEQAARRLLGIRPQKEE